LKQLLAVLFPFFLLPLVAQTTPPVVYAESFRQGAIRIIEDKVDVKLSPQDRTFHERLKDSHGEDRYEFTLVPIGPEGDTTITEWQAKLIDLRYGIYGNLLLTSQQRNQTGDLKNQLGRLDPFRFSQISADAKRIIKVENFYVVLQIKAFHFTPIESPYLDSMTVGVEFTNTDPRTTPDTAK
jgi:hypothetical protein